MFGVQGWVRVYSYTDPRANILGYRSLQVESHDMGWEERCVAEGAPHGQGILMRLEGCADRDQAALLMGRRMAVWRQQFPALPEGQFYWSDLVGLRVFTVAGVDLGVVESLLETGANDVLVVRDGRKERVIPFLWQSVVMSVDLEGGGMRVDWDPDF